MFLIILRRHSVPDCGYIENIYGTSFVMEIDTVYTAKCSYGLNQLYNASYECINRTAFNVQVCQTLGMSELFLNLNLNLKQI